MASIIFEKTFGGWARQPEGINSATGLSASVEGGKDEYAESDICSLFRLERLGDIAPGEMFQDMVGGTGFISSLVLNGVVASTGRAFVVQDNAEVAFFDVIDDIIDGTYAISGTQHVTTDDNDILAYQTTDGSEFIIWTWTQGTGTGSYSDIAQIRSSGANKSENWFSGLTGSAKLTANVPHKLWVGPDGIVYGTNGQYILSHDPGTTTSGNAQALNLGPNRVGVAGTIYGNYNAIVVRSKTLSGFAQAQSWLFLWDGFSPDPNFVFELEDYLVTGIINKDGQLRIFTQGRDNMTRIKTLSGNNIVTLFEHLAISNSPKQGSISINKNMVIWGQDGGTSFNISALMDLANGRVGHHEIAYPHLATTTIADIGMVKQLSANYVYAGNKVGSSYFLLRNNASSYYPNAQWRSALKTIPYNSTITKVRFRFSQFGSGASFTASLFEARDAMSVGGANDLLNKQITQATWGSVDEVSIPVYIPNISSFYMNIKFDHTSATDTAAIIQLIEVEYFTKQNT